MSAVAVVDVFDTRTIPVRFSNLKHMAKSPLHVLDALLSDSGRIPTADDSRPMRVGYTAHAILLGGKYVVFDGTRRGKKWDEFESAHRGERIVTASEYADAMAMAEAVRRHDKAMDLLDGEHEKELTWKIGGRNCIGHLDVLNRRRSFVTDLKTASSAHPDRFQWQARKMGYHAQLDWYREGAQVEKAFCVAVESKRPYPVTVFELTPEALEQGRKTWRLWFERFMACEESNQWPAYCESVVSFEAAQEDDVDLTFAAEQSEAILMGDD